MEFINDDIRDIMSIEDGCYTLERNGSFSEAVKYPIAGWNKLYISKVRLPDGVGNIVYLLTDTFENSFRLLNSQNFLIPPNYRKFFYPSMSYGSFLGRRYKLNLTKDRATRVNLIKANTKLISYPGKKLLGGDKTNIFFALADLFTVTSEVCKGFQAKKISQDFWEQFGKILTGMTPDKAATPSGPSDNNRIMLIDAEAFAFKPGAPLAENKLNPLFMIYLAYFRTRELSQLKFDMPILITAKNMFMKFNPATITPRDFNRFRTALFRIIKTNLDDYTATLPDLERNELTVTAGDITVGSTVDRVVDTYTKYSSPAIKGAVANAVGASLHDKAVHEVAKADLIATVQANVSKKTPTTPGNIFQKVNNIDSKPVDLTHKPVTTTTSIEQKRQLELERLYRSIIGSQPQSLLSDTDDDLPDGRLSDDEEDDLEAEIIQILNSDAKVAEEINDEVQDQIMPMNNPKTAPVNSARDAKMREAQKKIVVNNSTVEEILSKESSKVLVPIEDKSKLMTTTNSSVKEMKFANFDKAYQDHLFARDIIACFDGLKDKSIPLFIKSIDVQDSSTVADLKETWVVVLADQSGGTHKVTVDIPKFYQNRFLYLERNRYVILKQNLFLPVIKDTVDTVIVTSSNKKITMTRKSGKNMTLSQVGRLFKLISYPGKKLGDDGVFLPGDSTKINTNSSYVSSLEFDEIGRRLFRYVSGNTTLFFNRQYLKEMVLPEFDGTLQDDEFLIGYCGTEAIIINDSSGRDRKGRTICEIIEATLPPEAAKLMSTIKAGKQPMFVEAKMAGISLPIGVTLVVWFGLKRLLDAMGIDWKFFPNTKRIQSRAEYDQLKFSDGILEYKSEMYAQLILNGLNKIGTESFTFADFETEKCYYEYLHKEAGTYTFRSQLISFRDFFIDPITEEVCKDFQLPWVVDELMIYAVKLLTDNSHKSKVYDGFYRLRSSEIIPAILYAAVGVQYQRWVNSGQRSKFSLQPNIVIKELMAQKTVENYSVLNPATEVGKLNTVSAKGYAGSNMERAYNDEEKRSYDPSSIGKLAMSSPPDANIGITRELVVEPTITNARGYRTMVDDETINDLIDVNIFSPVEMMTPGTAAGDDPTRVSMANKQTKHQVPVDNAVPALVSNGYDEAIQFHLSNDFVINAEEDGEVVEFDERTGMLVVRYKSGKSQAFSTRPEIVKNSGSGFFLSSTLQSTVKVGDKVVKDQVLAYHNKYFTYSKMNGLRYAVGPLVKVAFMSTYNTYEDAGISTTKLSEMIRTAIVYQQDAPLTKVADIISMVKVGDHVRVNDPLLRYEIISDDANIANFISKLPSDESKELVADMGKSGIFAEHSGTIVKIQVTSLVDPGEMTESLAKIVSQHWDDNQAKEDLLSKYDDTPGIVKAGYMLTDSSGVYKNRYGRIGHYRGKDVVIEFYIEHSFVAGTGDKVAIYGANKNIIGEMIEPGYEPYSEFCPEEEISLLTSPGTIARRMTPSVLPVSMAMKIMVNLKRQLKKIAKF